MAHTVRRYRTFFPHAVARAICPPGIRDECNLPQANPVRFHHRTRSRPLPGRIALPGDCSPPANRGVVGAAPYNRFPRLSLRGRQAVAIRVPRPFSNVFKWQFENTTIFHFSIFVFHFPRVPCPYHSAFCILHSHSPPGVRILRLRCAPLRMTAGEARFSNRPRRRFAAAPGAIIESISNKQPGRWREIRLGRAGKRVRGIARIGHFRVVRQHIDGRVPRIARIARK